ncbi:MAG TPA: LuxR C-terminal-related transcriptional regulator [Bacteroidales bacterium]|nr:LuxR C-terminal-related transcriptional regulator [Bacteroidales bacterium]
MIIEVLIIVIITGLWLCLREFPIIIGHSFSSGILKLKYLPLVIAFSILFSLPFTKGISNNFNDSFQITTPLIILLITLSSAIAMWIFSLFSKWNSYVYSLFGAIMAYMVLRKDEFDLTYLWQSVTIWIISPVISCIISIILFFTVKYLIKKIDLHLIVLNRILRISLIVFLILAIFSLSINNGSIIIALTQPIDLMLNINLAGIFINSQYIVWAIFIIVVLALYFISIKEKASTLSIKLFDINTETSVIIMASVSLVMLLFSSNSVCSAIGLAATPVSPVHVSLASIIGIGLIHKSIDLNKGEMIKSALSIVLLPAFSFLLTNLTLRTVIADSSKQSLDITTFSIVTVLFLLVAIIVYFYISKNRDYEKTRLKRAEEINRLNEMQKVIVDMEIKVIQNENDNLHKRLEIKRKDLINNALWIGQQRNFLDEIYNEIKHLENIDEIEKIKEAVRTLEKKIIDKKAFSHEINELYSQVELLHKDFSSILHERFPNLTEQEKRIATLLRLGFSTKELSSIMSITPKSVEVCRYRLRKKMNLKRDENLIEFIKSL